MQCASERVKLLYVEDNALERWAFFRMIRDKGLPYDVTATETLAETRARLAESRFDLIVADYHLPDGHISELFAEIRDTPFLLLTATLEEQLVLRTLECGADDFLPKASLGRHLDALPFAVEKALRRQRAKDALRELNHRLATTLESITDAFLSVDREWTITSVNTAAEKICRMSRREVLGRNLWDVFPEAAGTRFDDEYHRALRENVTVHLEEYYAPLAFWAEVHAYPSAIGLAIYFRDITERKRAEEELRKTHDELEMRVRERTAELVAANEELRHAKEAAETANRAKSTFLANMSHELRTPLNAVIGMTELVLKNQLPGRQREFLTTARDSGEALLAAIDDILDFCMIEAGKLVLAEETFDLRESLGEAMKPFAVSAQAKGLALTSLVHPDVPHMVCGDSKRLRQVVMSLVGNAIEFTEHGEVRLEVACESAADPAPASGTIGARDLVLHFTVRDTGIGIPEDKRSVIFERFEQADNSLTRRHGGTGLGLPIASRLVGLMRGRIWVESEVGRGSCFHFAIHLSPAKPGSLEEKSSLPAEWRPAAERLRILLAERSLVNQKLAAGLLEGKGHVVTVVNNGTAALAAIETEKFDLVLMDVQMSEMGGLETTARIRAHERHTGSHVPIIAIINADASPEDRERSLKAGMDGYIAKPIRADELFAAIATWRSRTRVGQA